MYQEFKSRVLGQTVGDGQCVSLIINNPQAYCEFLFQGVAWPNILRPVAMADELVGDANGQYLTWAANDHNNPNQVPPQGAIVVFGATPAAGYSNTYPNPDGHVAIVETANAETLSILQQNAPWPGNKVNVATVPWRLSPVLGWYLPVIQGAPAPSSTPVASAAPTPVSTGNVGKTLHLAADNNPFHLYHANGPYVPADAIAVIDPAEFGGLNYRIVGDKGNGIYVINTQDFGQGALWTQGSDVTVS